RELLPGSDARRRARPARATQPRLLAGSRLPRARRGGGGDRRGPAGTQPASAAGLRGLARGRRAASARSRGAARPGPARRARHARAAARRAPVAPRSRAGARSGGARAAPGCRARRRLGRRAAADPPRTLPRRRRHRAPPRSYHELMSEALSERQQDILHRVVEEYVATGQPVGSRTLVDRSDFGVSSSTVRGELAELERIGLLTHPHTSAGRVPTEAGYRLYVDGLLERQEPRPSEFPLGLPLEQAEVEEALQATTEMLAQVTRLLALVSAPALQAATVRHVEVLMLQPRVVMTVVITSLGGVTKLRTEFPAEVDAGLASWAADYLNDRLTGVRIGSRAVRLAFEEPALARSERIFLDAIRPTFEHAADEDRRLYVGGAAGLLDEMREEEIGAYRSLMVALEKRAA